MVAKIVDGKLVIEAPLDTPTPSKSSGKTMVVASSNGPLRTGVKHPQSGQEIYVTLTSYFYPPKVAATA